MANLTQAGWKGSKPWSVRTMFLLLGLAVPTAAGSLGCKSSSQAPIDHGKGSHAPQIKAVMHLEPFVVNLADAEENRFLRVGIDLGLENPAFLQGG